MDDVKELTDEELMKEYQNGSEIAFSILYKKHSPKIYGFLLTKLRNRALADDIFQATFLKIHQSRAQYDSTRPLMPWLFTVCRNVMVDNLRKEKRFFEENNSNHINLVVAPEALNQTVTLNFDNLSENQRQVLDLHYNNELSFEEIAQKLKIAPSNVRQIKTRAIKKLRMLLEKTGSAK